MVLCDADEEFGFDVDAHSVARDDSFVLRPFDGDSNDVKIDGRYFVDDGEDERAPIYHDGLSPKPSSHKGLFLCRTVVKPIQEIDDHHDCDDRDDQPQNDGSDECACHCPLLSPSPWLDFLDA